VRTLRPDDATLIIISQDIMAFVAYELIAAAGFRYLRKVHPPEPPRTLLILRVFGFVGRSQRLLDDLGQLWRYLGPIKLIAGTDVADVVVQPHEFYDFLGGRLSRAFVKDQEDLESRLSESAPVADPDGLFRIQNFYCHDDTWRMTADRLARGADAVFMDLRGFNAKNCGCIYEIKLLVQVVPMDRVVLLVDSTTDVPLLERTLATAWQEIARDWRNVTPAKPRRVRVLQASRRHWQTLNTLIAMLYPQVERAGAVRERLAPADPSNAAWHYNLGISHERTGDVFLTQGKLQDALEAFETKRAIIGRLVAADPSNAAWQRDLSVSHNKVGDVLRAQSKLDKALAAYQASLAIAARLAAVDPINAGRQRDVCVTLWRLASIPGSRVTWAQVLTRMEAMKASGTLMPSDEKLLQEARARVGK
jgi:hypothetical protein